MAFLNFTPVARNGYANTTVRNINPNDILDVRAASATEIASFPTALTAIVVNIIQYNQPTTVTFLSATATATVLASIAAAQSGVLGSGASGSTSLVAGTKAITIPGLTTASIPSITLGTNANDALSVKYRAVPTANTLTITALLAAGTINTADTSQIYYAILG